MCEKLNQFPYYTECFIWMLKLSSSQYTIRRTAVDQCTKLDNQISNE